MDSVEKHALAVKSIGEQMEDFYRRGQKVKIFRGATNSTRKQVFTRGEYVDVSNLRNIIEINTQENYALVEPNVAMDELVDATLAHNLLPPIVMELPGITVGGGVQGGAGESSSFKYGGFHNTCLEYEIVLANGEIIYANPDSPTYADLYHGTHCSYGTLGVITLVKLQLIPAKKFIRLEYIKTHSFEETVENIKSATHGNVDFIDGIIYAQNHGVVMKGHFSDDIKLPVSTFSKPSDEWFYLHTLDISNQQETYEEYIPIRDYLFRYDRGAFWTGRYAFSYFKLPFTRFFRKVLDRLFKTRTLFKFLQATNAAEQYFVQDCCMPQERILDCLHYINHKLHIYPLWLCPLKPTKHDRLSPVALNTELVINIGVYGESTREYQKFVSLNRDFEHTVAQWGGRKVLYAHSYYSPEEFWNIYDKEWYVRLREKYNANITFPDVYEKIRVSKRHKVKIFRGIFNVVVSRMFQSR